MFRSPGTGDAGYVSVVTNDDFNTFQHNGYHEDDEEMDFTPQNGYLEPEEGDNVASKGR